MRAISDESAVDLALVLHFHQPVGNFDDVVDRITESCYRPLLERLTARPGLKVHLHLNGILLERFRRRAPDLVTAVSDLVSRGDAELLGGGLYEPILPVVPEDDAVGQIEALSALLERMFGVRPRGLWLTERVWEPRLPTPLARAGVAYTVLDDDILRWAGVEDSGLLGHWLTEDGGHPLALFAGLKALRYTIPFRPVDETFDLLAGLSRPDGERPLAVYADDAEKFGAWPDTAEWVYGRGWLDRFLDRLHESGSTRTVHLSSRLAAEAPDGRVYPPAASYPEMTEWALPTPARSRLHDVQARLAESDEAGALEFVRGGHWRGFLGKYPEADRMHKRMLEVSRRLAAASERHGPEAVATARLDLYRGQCNDPYWHGAFGGLYLVHLRRAVEGCLIRAERALDRLERLPEDALVVDVRDLDADGRDEIRLRTSHAAVLVDPGAGGCVTAWDLRDACENLVTVMQRHRESFHEALTGGGWSPAPAPAGPDAELGEAIETIHGPVRVKAGVGPEDLEVDRLTRVACREWQAAAGPAPEAGELQDSGARPLDGPWEARLPRPGAGGEGELGLSHPGEPELDKTLRLGRDDAGLEVAYGAARGPAPWTLISEWNLLVGHTGDDLEVAGEAGFAPAAEGRREQVSELRFRGGGGRSLRLRCDPAATVSWAAVRTVSSSEGGLEKSGQGTAFVVSWPVSGRLQARLRLTPAAPGVADEPAPGGA